MNGKGYFGETIAPRMSLHLAESRACKPSGFREYDSLTGYVTGQYTSEWQDKDGTRYRSIVTVINLGRPDRGAPVAPGMIEAEEHLPYEGPANWAQAVEASKQKRVERDAAMLGDLAEYLAENGPTTAPQIAKGLGVNRVRALRVLRNHPDTFVCIGQFKKWGLHGQTYTQPKVKRITNTMRLIRDYMLAHGPNTCSEIAKELGAHPTTIHNSIGEHPNWFCVVATYPRTGNMPATRVWGLTEEGRAGG